VELRDYLNILRARTWMIVLITVAFTLAAAGLSALQTPQYVATAKVSLSAQSSSSDALGALFSGGDSTERQLATQIQLMQVRAVAENVIRTLGLGTSPAKLLDQVAVTRVGQTAIVAISATDADPKHAADIANAMATEYVASSRSARRESLKAAADEVQRRLDDAKVEILALGRKINAQANRKTPAGQSNNISAEWAAQLSIATDLYNTLAQKLEELRVSEQLETGSGRVVESAIVNPKEISPKPVRSAILGLIAGLMVGMGAAVLLTYLDNTIKSKEEAEEVFRAPVLGHIPVEKLGKGESRRLTIVERPGSSAAEAYRALRNNLDFINFEHSIKTLLIASAAPGEGKSTLAANLAVSLAQSGKKVVLVNCDFRRPTTDQFLDVSNMIGLSDVLMGAHSLKSVLQRPRGEEVLVLTSGKMPPNPSELLGSQKMADLLTSLGEWADWIILDSPPLLAVADGTSLARWADAVLMVVRVATTSREVAKRGRDMLDMVGAHVAGVVVWGLGENSSPDGYGYYDGYRNYGGYRYHAGYISYGAESRSSDKAKKTKDKAKKKDATEEPPAEVRRALVAALAFVVALGVCVAIVYVLDRSLGWGLVSTLSGAISGGRP